MEEHKAEEGDYYDLLGVSTSATSNEVVIGYRKKAREVADLETSDPRYLRIKEVLKSNRSMQGMKSCL